jgi:hypothetical protein
MMHEMEHYANGISIQRAAIKTPTHVVEQLLDLRDQQLHDQYEFDGDIAIHRDSGIHYLLEKDILQQPVRVHPHGHDGMEAVDTQFWKDCDRLCYGAVLEYIKKYPTIIASLWWRNRGHVLIYEPGAFLGLHQDQDVGYTWSNRDNVVGKYEISTRNTISTTMHIVDSDGGEMHFPYADLTVEACEGDILIFPANYVAAHEVTPIKEGSRRISYLAWFGQGSTEPLVQPNGPLDIVEPVGDRVDPFMWCPTIADDFINASGWTDDEMKFKYPAWRRESVPNYHINKKGE